MFTFIVGSGYSDSRGVWNTLILISGRSRHYIISNFYKLSGEKRILKPRQILTKIEEKNVNYAPTFEIIPLPLILIVVRLSSIPYFHVSFRRK